MLSITLIYAQDAIKLADELRSEIESLETDWTVSQLPVLDSKSSETLWLALKRSTLKTDIVMFIISDQLLQACGKDLSGLTIPDRSKYRFACILMGRYQMLPRMQVKMDFELVFDEIKTNHSDFCKNNIDAFSSYCKLAEMTLVNDKYIKESRSRDAQKRYMLLFGFITVYIGTIICAYILLGIENNRFTNSSAQLMILLLLLFSFVAMIYGVYLAFRRIRKNQTVSDQEEFSNDLDLSLSKGSGKAQMTSAFSTILNSALGVNTLLSREIVDHLFLRNEAKQTEETSSSKDADQLEAEMSRTIGEDIYLPLGHLKLNWKQMKGYYDISKSQASSSFIVAVIICILGILIFLFALLSPLIPAFSSNESLIPIIGTIIGAIVEFFAGTILLVYKQSLSQMNLYHAALSDYQRYLSCINLVSMIEDSEKRNRLYEQIITEELQKSPYVQAPEQSP